MNDDDDIRVLETHYYATLAMTALATSETKN